MKSTLEVEHSRAYWERCGRSSGPVSVEEAFELATFGSRTHSRVERLMSDMRHRFDAFRCIVKDSNGVGHLISRKLSLVVFCPAG